MTRFQKFLLLFLGCNLLWMAEYITRSPAIDDSFDEYPNDTIMRSLKESTKYLLLWTRNDYAPFNFLGVGNEAFIKNRCPVMNCFVTNNKDFFGENVTKFDAIAFNGRTIERFTSSDLPNVRSPHQKYIYFNMESSDNQLMCNPLFDGFFNWTATYKLDSDIVLSYFVIKNEMGDEVGPRINMSWTEFDDDVHMSKDKSKAAAWMVSNCHTRSKREKYAQQLETALRSLGHTLDVYGNCGKLACPRTENSCDSILSKYHFYLSFENSIAEDYVTEKLYTALKNGVVPVVFGGANYSRFLPPGSYLDARKHTPKKLAMKMAELMKNPSAYNSFFKWRNHYTYHRSEQVQDVCRVCSALNDRTMLRTRGVYDDFREWWNPDYRHRCPGVVSNYGYYEAY